MKTILAAIDFSEITDAVVAEAARLAQCHNGRVVLVAVAEPPVVATEYAPFIENLADMSAAAEKALARRLGEAQRQVASQGLECIVAPHDGAPVQHIVNEAKNHAADYIVMGSHGHTALHDLLVGSTTHGVLLRASCPVVILPPKHRKIER